MILTHGRPFAYIATGVIGEPSYLPDLYTIKKCFIYIVNMSKV